MEDELRVLVTLGFTLLLVMLRLEAEKFGAAEYDEPSADGRPPALRWRLVWYLMGLLLLLGADLIHPSSGTGLFLRIGNQVEAIVFGVAFAGVGALLAAAFAWLRYQRLRLPPSRYYPGALLNALATAFVDESVFRGLLLAFLLGTGMDGASANVIQALVYALATRLGGGGRDLYTLLLILVVGLFGGWLTIITGGIGAAFIGHAVTRLTIFLVTSHAGRVAPDGPEAEDREQRRMPPAGWRRIGAKDASREG